MRHWRVKLSLYLQPVLPLSFDDYLLQREMVSPRDLERALQLAGESDESLDVFLVRLGLVAEADNTGGV